MTSTQPAPSANSNDLAITAESLARTGITSQVAWAASLWSGKITAPARRQPGNAITLAEGIADLIDSDDDVVQFKGANAAATAAAYYAQAGLTYAAFTSARVPAWIALVLEMAKQIDSGQRAADAGAKRATALATARGLNGKPAATRKPAARSTAKPAATRARTTQPTPPAAPAVPATPAPKPREEAMPATKSAPRKPAAEPKPARSAPAAPAPAPQGPLAVPQCDVRTCSAPSELLMTSTVSGEQITVAVCTPHSDPAATLAPITPNGLELHTVAAHTVAPGTMPWAMPAELAAAWTVTRTDSYLNRRDQPRMRWTYANGQTAMFAFGEMVTGHFVPGDLPGRR